MNTESVFIVGPIVVMVSENIGGGSNEEGEGGVDGMFPIPHRDVVDDAGSDVWCKKKRDRGERSRKEKVEEENWGGSFQTKELFNDVIVISKHGESP